MSVLRLVEGERILNRLEQIVVDEQLRRYCEAKHSCPTCGARRSYRRHPGRRHDIDPQLYLTQLLVNLPAEHVSDLPDWLPDRWKATQKTRLATLQNQPPYA